MTIPSWFSRLRELTADLPIWEGEDSLRELLLSGRGVITSPAGSGKTTLVPLFLAHLLEKRIVVVQPRRVSARAGAKRLQELATTLGLGKEFSAYTIRDISTLTPSSRIEMVTPGVLLRRLLSDPEQNEVSAIVFDEIHERAWDADLSFSLCADIRENLRDDLSIYAMSATTSAQSVSSVLNQAPILDIPGQIHPVETIYAPPPTNIAVMKTRFNGSLGVNQDFLKHVSDTAKIAFEESSSNVLVFLPGLYEIDFVSDALKRTLSPKATILPLHGRLSVHEQDLALLPSKDRKIILATDIAQTSLTVYGVDTVVDAGLSRQPRYDVLRDASELVTQTCSQADMIQRAGRAGRLGPGRVWRCFPASTFATAREQTIPEIEQTDLCELALILSYWGDSRGESLRWISPLPSAALARAQDTLCSLGAVDSSGVTPLGKKILSLPLSPPIAAALTQLRSRYPLRKLAKAAAIIGAQERPRGADLLLFVDSFSAELRKESTRLEEKMKRFVPAFDSQVNLGATILENILQEMAALAFPGRIARQRESGSREYLLANGSGARLPQDSPLFDSKWICVASLRRLSGQKSLEISAALKIDSNLAYKAGKKLMRSQTEIEIDSSRKIFAHKKTYLGAIEISNVPLTKITLADFIPLVSPFLKRFKEEDLPYTQEARDLIARLRFLADISSRVPSLKGIELPEFSLDTLRKWAEEVITEKAIMVCHNRCLPKLAAGDILSRLPWELSSRLDELAPTHQKLPIGAPAKIDYYRPIPTISVPLQQCFGWQKGPSLAQETIPLTIELLSPARRPLATTSDLESFWAGAYQQVRAQMRGRYPKHPWPEDPLSAIPTTKAKPRR
ncbi:ATP-dependent helicase HrpB [Actinomycetaceae bacterium TAE3-ERU4]|nr:ATP-dependent helicase HrpB [Actinomycetaceae bacterium TAE3-ERU4]